jgi:nitrite reductase/ring-hydroxylating ferredoxin subunit
VTGGAFAVCKAEQLPPGERVVVDLGGRSVGVFNVDGRFYALHNRCPHRGGPLCLGPITGLTRATEDFGYAYGDEGHILRCAWHGWEFEIATGRAIADAKMRAKAFRVTVEDGEVVVHI